MVKRGMDNAIDLVKNGHNTGGVIDATAMGLRPFCLKLCGGSVAAGQPNDGMAAAEQFVHDGGADKPGGPGDEDFHAGESP